MKNVIYLVRNSGDKRKRYRFLLAPMNAWLSECTLPEVRIEVIDEAGGATALIRAIGSVIQSKAEGKRVIYFGAGFKGLLWVVACRIGGIDVLLRHGGDEVYIFRELARESFQSGNYRDWMRFHVNRLSAKLAIRGANGMIVVSPKLAERIRRGGNMKPERPIFVVHQPISEVLAGRTDRKLPEINTAQAVRFLSVTNLMYRDKLEPIKDIIDALLTDAWRSCIEKGTAVEYVVAGGGMHLEELQQHAESVAPLLAKRNVAIRLLGHVDDLDTWFAEADLFIYGSRNDGIPNVVLEAQWYGLPIVVNDTEEHRQLLQEGRNALYYRSGDSDDLARTLCRIVFSREERRRMARQNYHDVRERFGQTAVLKQVAPLMHYCMEAK